MKKRTRAAQKRLNNLLLILLLTAVLLVMSTYAWFTANKTVNIDSIDLKVATSSGLQISADGKNWKTILEFKDIKNAKAVNANALNQIPYMMAPVSSALNVNTNGFMEMFYGDMDTDLNNTSAHYGEATVNAILAARPGQTTEIDSYGAGIVSDSADGSMSLADGKGEYDAGYYMAFDVWLKDTVPAEHLYMSGEVKDKAAADEAKQASNAMRVALVKGQGTNGVHTNVSNPEDTDTIAAIQALTTKGGKVYLWEPNNDKHSEKAQAHATDLVASATTDVNKALWTIPTSGTNFTRMPYDAVKATTTAPIAVSDATASSYSSNFERIVTDSSTYKFLSTGKNDLVNYDLDNLVAGATKYRIYIWMEGQDVDCQNDASGGNMVVNLQFSLNAFTAAAEETTP